MADVLFYAARAEYFAFKAQVLALISIAFAVLSLALFWFSSSWSKD